MLHNHLRSVQIRPIPTGQQERFPFNIPAIKGHTEIVLDTAVTFFVGENGSGKSTLLEALATAVGATTIGAEELARDQTLAHAQELAGYLKLVWSIKTRHGFFLRAEDFFGYVKRLAQMKAELQAEVQRVEREYNGRSQQAKNLARMPFAGQLHHMRQQYGRDLNTYSHGESFLELFQSRLRPNGLYLLDEPEAPLSPTRQLTLLAMIKQMAAQNCQFIIATHSPILMAYPGAAILSFDYAPARHVTYEELEHVTVTRSFLNDPEAYLRHL
ncbi:MAG: AAA family ATPase [Ardenticatenaceae bacterium]|nr:AAA family ATPase [Ardenticatenaceae bacterium]